MRKFWLFNEFMKIFDAFICVLVIFTYLYFNTIVFKLSFSHASGKIWGETRAPPN